MPRQTIGHGGLTMQHREHRDVQVARITARQGIAVAAITAIAGLIGAAIGRQTDPGNQPVPERPGARTMEGGCYRVRVVSPESGDSVTPPYVVSGISDPLPAGYK